MLVNMVRPQTEAGPRARKGNIVATHQTRSGGAACGDRSGPLRLFLKLDAAACGALGVMALAFGWLLDDLLGTPTSLLAPVGVFLIAWAAGLWFIASRNKIRVAAVWAVIVFNFLWALDSVILVAAGWFSLTGSGVALVFAQAAAVAVIAAAQLFALRRL